MTDRNRNALIGLFALGGMFCLATLIVLFGESRGLFQREYVIRAKFDSQRSLGVRQGTEVNLVGVWVGTVGSVELVDMAVPSKGLFVQLWVDQKFSVPRGSIAKVAIPLMGQPVVNITPPVTDEALPSLPHDGEAEIRGIVVNPLESIIDPKLMATIDKTTGQLGELASALTPAAKAITGLLEERTIEQVEGPGAAVKGMTANLYTAVQRLHSVLKHFDTVLGDPAVQSNVKLALDNFRTASESAKLAVEDFRLFSTDMRKLAGSAQGTMSKLDETVLTTRGHIDALGTRLTASADKLSQLIDYFMTVGQSLAEGQGSAGMLLRDPKLYDELLLTIQRLGGAASEMQALIKQWQAQGMGVKLR